MSVDFKDNSPEVLARIAEAIDNGLEICGQRAETYAKALCPVDTGLLRNSITHLASGAQMSAMGYHAKYGSNRNAKGKRVLATSRNAGTVKVGRYDAGVAIGEKEDHEMYIGTNVEYAPYVEFGARSMKPRPYIRPAVQDHIAEYEHILRNEIAKAMK